MTHHKTPYRTRIEKRTAARLRKFGMKLTKRGDGYAVLVFNEVVGGWIELDGLTPIPYSLSLEDVIRLAHQEIADREVDQLREQHEVPTNVVRIA